MYVIPVFSWLAQKPVGPGTLELSANQTPQLDLGPRPPDRDEKDKKEKRGMKQEGREEGRKDEEKERKGVKATRLALSVLSNTI